MNVTSTTTAGTIENTYTPDLYERWIEYLKEKRQGTGSPRCAHSPCLYDRWVEYLSEKRVTKSPQRSSNTSPRRKAASYELPNIHAHSTLSQFIDAVDYNKYGGKHVIDDVPEREWRLLANMAKKKEQDLERENLAAAFKKMWQKEKAEREIAAQTADEYRRFITKKRENEKLDAEFRNLQRERDNNLKKTLLINSIRNKDERSSQLIHLTQDLKTQELEEKALDFEAREILAADRRNKQRIAEELRKRAEMQDGLRKLEEAQRKRDTMLRNSARRLAINNALNAWESTLLLHEVRVEDEYKRAQHAAHAQLTSMRSESLAHQKALKQKRARCKSAFTEQLREAIRMQ